MGDFVRTTTMFFVLIAGFLAYLAAGFLGIQWAYVLAPEPWGYFTGGLALTVWAAIGFTVVTMSDSF